MNRLLLRVAAVAAAAIVTVVGSVDAWAERRVALVVGNANYKIANISLANPRNDAQDISAVLATLGFEVVTAIDASKRDMDFALQRFARLATDADSALFFYAGHAMQFQGRNFLMPTDAELEDEISVRYQTVSLEEVRAALDRASGVKIMILDACRNNPLADRLQKTIVGASRAVATTRGLARIDKTQGMVVAYATAADEVAQDGQGRNSPFTTALLKRLQEPGLEIEMMFRRVAYDVNAQTGGRQRPETYISLLSEYYLNQSDRIVWDRIKDQDDVAALRDFVNKYPSSPHAIFARNRLDLLERYAREREEFARRAREEEQRRTQEAEAQRVAREAALRREAEERLRNEQLAAQKRMEEDQRRQEAARQETARQEAARQEALRQEALRLQHEEQKRQDALRQHQDEQKRLAALQQKQEEQKRQDALRQQQDEQKRLAALQQQQEEQKRQEALRQQQEEQKRLAALQQQQEEQKRQDALRQQADTERRRIEETCRREEAKLAELQVLGASAREQLVKLEIEAGCKALRPLITAAIAALPADIPPVKPVPVTPPAGPTPALQPAKANLPEQIRQAQTKLRQLGCFGGAPDGKMNEATRNAVKAFWSHTHKPIVEINITDEFIADLEQHHDRICAPPPVKRDPVPVATHQRPPRSEPAPPREASRPAPPPAAQAPAARATAGATPPSPGMHTIGTGF
ncbi:MAG TPA: caspase family protein [Xanthobacteraceae bacterium]|nr:caspase family protein [Xanthobacteraceae bacterium]